MVVAIEGRKKETKKERKKEKKERKKERKYERKKKRKEGWEEGGMVEFEILVVLRSGSICKLSIIVKPSTLSDGKFLWKFKRIDFCGPTAE